MKTHPTCPSCGKPYEGHGGLIGTCAKLQRALRALRKIDELSDTGAFQMVDLAMIMTVCKAALAEIDPPKTKRKAKV